MTDDRAERASGQRTKNAAATFVGGAVPTVDAATVLLLRDGADGLEVLLVERHGLADFAGGAYVFPGGKVTDGDRDLDPARWSGPPLAELRVRTGCTNTRDVLGLLVAAVRETFEEAGVLLARRGGEPIEPAEVSSPSYQAVRARLSERGVDYDWRPWLESEGLVLDLGAIELWAWWVTPEGQHKRFDTRFFAALLPEAQSPVHDDVETTSLRWSTPSDALREQAEGHVKIIFPTRRVLSSLEPFSTADAALAAARAGEVDQRRVQPTLRHDAEGSLWVQHPFDGTEERI